MSNKIIAYTPFFFKAINTTEKKSENGYKMKPAPSDERKIEVFMLEAVPII